MGVVTAIDLPNLAGCAPASSNQPDASVAIPDEEALSNAYIPADGLSACLITPHRILVTAGAAENDRVLPFSVIRYLDLSHNNHTWTKPQHLRRKRGSTDIPVPRVEHSLTHVPHDGRLYLFGGMKIEPDMGNICKTLFAFDPKNRAWQRVDLDNRLKSHPHDFPGPRYAHSAVYVQLRERGSRPNSRAKPAPSLVVYGGYSSHDDTAPLSHVHVLNIRTCRWALHPSNSTLAPGRANHAAAVTNSHRYMVIHGGNHSDNYDESTISDMLFVYDFQHAKWSTPVRHSSSADPPTARRRHSLVNGVGRHQGWLVMYGGHLRDGNFSNDMFMCKIIEPSNRQTVACVWEKIHVRGSIHTPISGGHALKRRTVAGGCLVPIPKLRKYILLGGKGELGLRHVPLLLDPYESDEIAISQSIPVEEEEEHDLHEHDDVIARLEDGPTVNGRHAENAPSRGDESGDSDRGEEFVFDMDKNTLRGSKASKTKRARSALSTPSGEKPSSVRHAPSVSVTPSEKSPIPLSAAGKAGDGDGDSHPNTNVTSPIALRLRIRSADRKKKVESPCEEDFVKTIMKHPRSGRNNDLTTPPTKRGRFLAPEESDDIQPIDFGSNNDSEVALKKDSADISPNYHSEFLSASELARKGKRAGRGRGRGRGRGGNVRARTADDKAGEKAYQALEKLNEKNEERIAHLEAENIKLINENSYLKNDNHSLNEQYKRSLEDVRTLRVKESTRKKDTVTAVSAQTRRANGSTPGSQMEINGKSSSVFTDVDSLRKTIAELQAEVARITSEKEGLVASVQDLEEEKRGVQKELFVMKNKIDRIAVDRDSYHQELKQLHKELGVTNKDKEEADKRARRAEEELTLRNRDVELLKADFKVEQQRHQDGKLELSNTDRRVKIVEGQLADVTKRSDDFKASEKQVKADLEKAKERNAILQRQFDDTLAENRKLEDEKIEISSQRESMQLELHAKIKECSAALKDAEKCREALERERMKRANEDTGGEYVRIRAEIERTKKECAGLRTRCRRFGSLEYILPQLQAITEKVSAVFADDKEAEDVEAVLSQAWMKDGADGEIKRGKNDTGKEKTSKGDESISKEGAQDGKTALNAGSCNEQSSVNQVNHAQGADDIGVVPDSEDVDEP